MNLEESLVKSRSTWELINSLVFQAVGNDGAVPSNKVSVPSLLDEQGVIDKGEDNQENNKLKLFIFRLIVIP